MDTVKRLAIVVLAGVFGLGPMVIAQSAGAAAPDAEQLSAKREDTVTEVVALDDDDDDDTNSRRTRGDRSGATRNSNDGTNSRKTGLSRDRDRSRGDLTKDRTRDGRGGDLTRDHSRHQTNDHSRDDTR